VNHGCGLDPSLRTTDQNSEKLHHSRELLKLTTKPEIISFASGPPAPEMFPVEQFREACKRVLATQATTAPQYGPSEGYKPLRELILA
jgi:2-aminoadipate transaminase